jgi:hypothetical protein
MTGMRTGKPLPLMNRAARPISKRREVCGRPPSIKQTFAVVPPMSKETSFSMPHCRATRLASIAPPLGPDSTRRMGKRVAVSSVVMPPPEVMISRGHAKPSLTRVRDSDLR